MDDLISRQAGILILVQYIVEGIRGVHIVRERRFCAETDEDVKAGIRQLYDNFCEEYPLEEFPNRQIHICGVFREILCDMDRIVELVEGEVV